MTISILLFVPPSPQFPHTEKNIGRKEKQMYLKEGNIGKAESEEVVPVETEQKSRSLWPCREEGGRQPPSSRLTGRQEYVLCRTEGEPTPRKSFTLISSLNLHPAGQ